MCCSFQTAIVPFLQQVFMPIVSTIFRALTTTIDERDQVSQTERKLLQRGYFTFISTLVNNSVTEVLSTQSMGRLYSDSDLLNIVARRLKINNANSENNITQQYKKIQFNAMQCHAVSNNICSWQQGQNYDIMVQWSYQVLPGSTSATFLPNFSPLICLFVCLRVSLSYSSHNDGYVVTHKCHICISTLQSVIVHRPFSQVTVL